MTRYIVRALTVLLCVLLTAPAMAVALRDEVWVANGPLYSSATSSDLTVFFLGASAGATVVTDGLPRVNGPVHTVIPDGAGGCFIGGEFTRVGGQPRANLAHIDALKRLTDWAPDPNGAVYALVLSGSALFVGGEFTSIAGVSHANLAAVSAVSGATDRNWVPDPNGPVYTLLTGDNILYAGGDFTQIAGVGRNRLAVLDLTTAVAGTWNPAADGAVRALVLSGSTLYAGGDFTHIGGAARNRLAIVGTDTAVASSWNPAADATVRALALKGGLLYVGGDFGHIGGASRARIAALVAASGTATTWNPGADAGVHALLFNGNSLYAAGAFSEIGGVSRRHIARLNVAVTSGITDPVWNAGADDAGAGPIEALALSGDLLYAGGEFDALNGSSRRASILYLGGAFDYVGPATGAGVAIASAGTGTVDADFPRVNGPVHAAVADGSGGWFIGGEFTQVGDQARANLAHIDAAGTVTAWAPAADGAVRALALAGSVLYVGGEFLGIDATARSRIAAVAAGSGTVTTWNPAADGAVLTLLVDGTTVYAGGGFTAIGGAARNGIAALDTASGAATAWDPGANGAVRALALAGTTLYAGGDFTQIGGASRNRIAALAAGSGVATAWDPDADGAVRALSLAGTTLYAGGDFTQVGGASRNRIAELAAGSGVATTWNPDANGAVHTLLLTGTTLYAGGAFTTVEGVARNRLAALDTTVTAGITDAGWDPSAGDTVEALALAGSVLYAGGAFTSVNGVTRHNIAALDLATGAATAWDPDADGAVRALQLAADGTTLYLGGDFTAIAGQNRGRLAGVNTSTAAVTAWNPGANGSVYALAAAGNGVSLYVGGTFSTLSTVARDWLGEVSLSAAGDNQGVTLWDPAPADGTGVYALAVDGDTLYVGGDFEHIDGKERHRLAAFDTTVPAVTAWAPQIDDGSVRVLLYAADSDTLYVGGDFTSVANKPRRGLVAFDPDVAAPLAWDPQLAGAVGALARSFDRTHLYAGGDFTAADGAPRRRLAALTSDDGTADADWIVDSDAAVNTLALVNNAAAGGYTLYAGGGFTTIDGGVRQALAALAALPLEQAAPVTTAVPAGGLHNGVTKVPIELLCDDGDGSGCAATYYTTDGTEPTTASAVYTGAIAFDAAMVLKFFSIDNAGNAEAVRTETYSVEADAPLTRASPTTRQFSSNSITVTLSCDDGTGTGCAATYYTLDGSAPNTGSTPYTHPITIDRTVVLKFFSVDGAGNAEGTKREEYAHVDNKAGAVGGYELLAIAAGAWLRRRRRVRDAAR
jgi:hypothetical protein